VAGGERLLIRGLREKGAWQDCGEEVRCLGGPRRRIPRKDEATRIEAVS